MTVISTQYASGIVAATEKAAIASSKLIGLGDEKAADQVAVDAMRTALNAIDFLVHECNGLNQGTGRQQLFLMIFFLQWVCKTVQSRQSAHVEKIMAWQFVLSR